MLKKNRTENFDECNNDDELLSLFTTPVLCQTFSEP